MKLELPQRISKSIDRVKNIRPQEKLNIIDSKNTAYDALLCVGASEYQVPLATFDAEGQAVFDLRRLHPGTVFRVAMEDEYLDNYYVWYATGNKKSRDIPDVYEFGHTNEDEDLRYSWNATLSLGPSWEIFPTEVISPYFPVGDFFSYVSTLDTEPSDEEPEDYVLRIDIISGGKPVKEKSKQREAVVFPKLTFVPELAPIKK